MTPTSTTSCGRTDDARRRIPPRGLDDAEAQRAAAAKFGSRRQPRRLSRSAQCSALEQVVQDCPPHAARPDPDPQRLDDPRARACIGVTTTLVTLVPRGGQGAAAAGPDRIVKLSLGFAGDVNRRVNGHVAQFSHPEFALSGHHARALVAGFRHERGTRFRRQPPSHRGGARHGQLFQRAAVGQRRPAPDRRRSSAASRRNQSPALTDGFGQDPVMVLRRC